MGLWLRNLWYVYFVELSHDHDSLWLKHTKNIRGRRQRKKESEKQRKTRLFASPLACAWASEWTRKRVGEKMNFDLEKSLEKQLQSEKRRSYSDHQTNLKSTCHYSIFDVCIRVFECFSRHTAWTLCSLSEYICVRVLLKTLYLYVSMSSIRASRTSKRARCEQASYRVWLCSLPHTTANEIKKTAWETKKQHHHRQQSGIAVSNKRYFYILPKSEIMWIHTNVLCQFFVS